MKKITIPVFLAAFLAFGSGCNSNAGSDTAANADSVSSTGDNSMSSGSAASTSTGAGSDTGSNMSANTSSASASAADTSKGGDQAFVLDAASGGLMEVELGKMASTVGSSAKVKEFGRMMVTDHTKANAELKAVAAKKNITVPATPAAAQQQHIDDMKTKKGADFDKAYVELMVDDHKEDVAKFEGEAQNGKDADVKAFASKTLPVLNKHLTHVKMLQDGMK